MSKPTIARYAITFGMPGYMSDWHGGAFEVTTRRDLAAIIRDTLRLLDLPATLFREARINRLWSFIKRHGSSSAHFNLYHGGHVLSFYGLTEDEYTQQQQDEI